MKIDGWFVKIWTKSWMTNIIINCKLSQQHFKLLKEEELDDNDLKNIKSHNKFYQIIMKINKYFETLYQLSTPPNHKRSFG